MEVTIAPHGQIMIVAGDESEKVLLLRAVQHVKRQPFHTETSFAIRVLAHIGGHRK